MGPGFHFNKQNGDKIMMTLGESEEYEFGKRAATYTGFAATRVYIDKMVTTKGIRKVSDLGPFARGYLEELMALERARRTVTVQRFFKRLKNHGLNIEQAKGVTCTSCRGTGNIPVNPGPSSWTHKCYACYGSGKYTPWVVR